ncbi:MAG: sulfotransferase [Pseudomonadota bacterium]
MTVNAPIFIGGLFKSGTSLLRSMLGQHRSIASGLETYWFDLDWNNKSTPAFDDRLSLIAKFYNVCDDDVRRYLDQASPERFLAALLGEFAERMGKRRWAEKTPGNILHLDRIFAAWPDARVVHIRRDPRDVLASLRQAQKWDTPAEFMKRWSRFLGAAERFKAELECTKTQLLEVHYEDLIESPERTMRNIVEFVGEAWDPAVAEHHGDRHDFEVVQSATGKESSTLKRLAEPISASRIEIWRDILTDTDIRDIEAEALRCGLANVMRGLQR